MLKSLWGRASNVASSTSEETGKSRKQAILRGCTRAAGAAAAVNIPQSTPRRVNPGIWIINQRRRRRLMPTRIGQLFAESDRSAAARRRHKSAAAPDLGDMSEGNEEGADSPPLDVFVSGETSQQEMKDGDGKRKSSN